MGARKDPKAPPAKRRTVKKMNAPSASAKVVVVTYNNAGSVEAFLRGVITQGNTVQELVVRDNGSTDDTVARIGHLANHLDLAIPLTIDSGSNLGFASGVAAAASLSATSAPLLVVNPDVVLTEGAVETLLIALGTHNDIGIATLSLQLPNGEEDPASRRRFPGLWDSALYSILGRWTPRRFRYNADAGAAVASAPSSPSLVELEATTGALMLLNPAFRDGSGPIFDTDYWMYGEDLQLCLAAHQAGFRVVLVEGVQCLHMKGFSSGLPRSRTSDRAFHDAMYLYYLKNLTRGRLEAPFVRAAIQLRYILSRIASRLAQ